MRKTIALAVAFCVFTTQIALGSLAESNLWAERNKNKQLASLPVSLQNAAQVLRHVPSPNTTRIDAGVPARSKAGSNPVVAALPLSYGTLRDVSLPSSRSSKTVILIQDVHRNAEAQTNIGKAVEELINQGTVSLVGLEGAGRAIDVSAMRSFPDAGITKDVADYLLRDHKISGPVHAALTLNSKSQIPNSKQISTSNNQTKNNSLEFASWNLGFPVFVGVDDEQHYLANVDAYRESAARQTAYKNELTRSLAALAEKKRNSFSPALKEFDDRAQAYARGGLKMGAYLKTLANQSGDKPLSVETFLTALEMEERLDFNRVEAERARVFEKLVNKLKKDDVAALIDLGMAYRMGRTSHSKFYSALYDLCRKNDVLLTSTPAMEAYIKYVLLADSIKGEQLFEDVAALEQKVYAKLIKTPAEKKLVAEGKLLSLQEKLVDFSLTPQEWDEYKLLDSKFQISNSKSQTNANLKKDKKLEIGNSQFGWDLEFGSWNLSSFEDFYHHAEARNQFLADNLLKAMDENKVSVAVLVAGGFHSAGIKELLEKKKVGAITFAPKITKVDALNGSAYLSIFTQEKTPLEKLFEGEKLFLAEQPGSAASFVSGVMAQAGLGKIRRVNPEAQKNWERSSPKGLKDFETRVKAGGTEATVTATIDSPEGPRSVRARIESDANGKVAAMDVDAEDRSLEAVAPGTVALIWNPLVLLLAWAKIPRRYAVALVSLFAGFAEGAAVAWTGFYFGWSAWAILPIVAVLVLAHAWLGVFGADGNIRRVSLGDVIRGRAPPMFWVAVASASSSLLSFLPAAFPDFFLMLGFWGDPFTLASLVHMTINLFIAIVALFAFKPVVEPEQSSILPFQLDASSVSEYQKNSYVAGPSGGAPQTRESRFQSALESFNDSILMAVHKKLLEASPDYRTRIETEDPALLTSFDSQRIRTLLALFLDVPLTNPNAFQIRPGEKIGDYEIVSELGRGAFGAVYRAVDSQGREAAVKVPLVTIKDSIEVVPQYGVGNDEEELNPLSLMSPIGSNGGHAPGATVADYIFAVGLLIQEEQRSRELGAATQAVPRSFGMIPDEAAMAMELIRGKTLAQKKETLTKADIVHVLNALIEIHESGAVHNDISPENIMLEESLSGGARARLIDWAAGVTEKDKARGSTLGRALRSLVYGAPERADFGRESTASDVYSLAVVLTRVLPPEWLTRIDVLEILAEAVALSPEKRPSARRLLEKFENLPEVYANQRLSQFPIELQKLIESKKTPVHERHYTWLVPKKNEEKNQLEWRVILQIQRISQGNVARARSLYAKLWELKQACMAIDSAYGIDGDLLRFLDDFEDHDSLLELALAAAKKLAEQSIMPDAELSGTYREFARVAKSEEPVFLNLLEGYGQYVKRFPGENRRYLGSNIGYLIRRLSQLNPEGDWAFNEFFAFAGRWNPGATENEVFAALHQIVSSVEELFELSQKRPGLWTQLVIPVLRTRTDDAPEILSVLASIKDVLAEQENLSDFFPSVSRALRQTRGAFDPDNKWHRIANYYDLTVNKSMGNDGHKLTWQEYNAMVDEVKELSDESAVPEADRIQLRALVYEAYRLAKFIGGLENVVVVANKSYGEPALEPIRAWLKRRNIRVIGTKIGSTDAHTNPAVVDFANTPLFSDDEIEYFLRNRPNVVVVDGSYSVDHNKIGQFSRQAPRFPDAYQGYRNFFIALNEATRREETPQDLQPFQKNNEFLATLYQDAKFAALVKHIRAIAQRLEKEGGPQYQMRFWTPAFGSRQGELKFSENRQIRTDDPPIYDAVADKETPTVIMVQSTIENPAHPNLKLKSQAPTLTPEIQGWIGGPNVSAYFDDKNHFKNFHYSYAPLYGVSPSLLYAELSRRFFVDLVQFLGETEFLEPQPDSKNVRELDGYVFDLTGTLTSYRNPIGNGVKEKLEELLALGKKTAVVTDDTEESDVERRLVNRIEAGLRKNLLVYLNGGKTLWTFDESGRKTVVFDRTLSALDAERARDAAQRIAPAFTGDFSIETTPYDVRLTLSGSMEKGIRDRIVDEINKSFRGEFKAYKLGKDKIVIAKTHKKEAVDDFLDRQGLSPARLLIAGDGVARRGNDSEMFRSFPHALKVNIGAVSRTLRRENSPNAFQIIDGGIRSLFGVINRDGNIIMDWLENASYKPTARRDQGLAYAPGTVALIWTPLVLLLAWAKIPRRYAVALVSLFAGFAEGYAVAWAGHYFGWSAWAILPLVFAIILAHAWLGVFGADGQIVRVSLMDVFRGRAPPAFWVAVAAASSSLLSFLPAAFPDFFLLLGFWGDPFTLASLVHMTINLIIAIVALFAFKPVAEPPSATETKDATPTSQDAPVNVEAPTSPSGEEMLEMIRNRDESGLNLPVILMQFHMALMYMSLDGTNPARKLEEWRDASWKKEDGVLLDVGAGAVPEFANFLINKLKFNPERILSVDPALPSTSYSPGAGHLFKAGIDQPGVMSEWTGKVSIVLSFGGVFSDEIAGGSVVNPQEISVPNTAKNLRRLMTGDGMMVLMTSPEGLYDEQAFLDESFVHYTPGERRTGQRRSGVDRRSLESPDKPADERRTGSSDRRASDRRKGSIHFFRKAGPAGPDSVAAPDSDFPSASVFGARNAFSAPFWEWVFQLPVLIAVFYGADVWTGASVILLSSLGFALAHLPVLISERDPEDGVGIILARLGVLFGAGGVLSLLLISPLAGTQVFLAYAGISWSMVMADLVLWITAGAILGATGLVLNIAAHWDYNKWLEELKRNPKNDAERTLGRLLPYAALIGEFGEEFHELLNAVRTVEDADKDVQMSILIDWWEENKGQFTPTQQDEGQREIQDLAKSLEKKTVAAVNSRMREIVPVRIDLDPMEMKGGGDVLYSEGGMWLIAGKTIIRRETGAAREITGLDDGPITQIQLSKDGRLIALQQSVGPVRHWRIVDVETAAAVPVKGLENSVVKLVELFSGGVAAVQGPDDKFWFINAKTGEKLDIEGLGNEPVVLLSPSPDQQYADVYQKIGNQFQHRIVDIKKRKVLVFDVLGKERVQSILFSEDGEHAALRQDRLDSDWRVVHIKSGQLVKFKGDGGRPWRRFTFNSNGRFGLFQQTNGDEDHMRVADIQADQLLTMEALGDGPIRSVYGISGSRRLIFVEQGDAGNTTARIVNFETENVVHTPGLAEGEIYEAFFDSADRYVFVKQDANEVFEWRILDAVSGALVTFTGLPPGPIADVYTSSNGDFAVIEQDFEVRVRTIVDLKTRAAVAIKGLPKTPLIDITFSPGGRFAYIAQFARGGGLEFRIVDLRAGEVLSFPGVKDQKFHSIRFSPDDREIFLQIDANRFVRRALPDAETSLAASILGREFAGVAAYWEWIFQLPALIAVLMGADAWTTGLVILITSVVFALAHLPVMIMEGGDRGDSLILARLGILFGVGAVLSVLLVGPLIGAQAVLSAIGLPWSMVATDLFFAVSLAVTPVVIGFALNIAFHDDYNDRVHRLKRNPQNKFEEALGRLLPYASVRPVRAAHPVTEFSSMLADVEALLLTREKDWWSGKDPSGLLAGNISITGISDNNYPSFPIYLVASMAGTFLVTTTLGGKVKDIALQRTLTMRNDQPTVFIDLSSRTYFENLKAALQEILSERDLKNIRTHKGKLYAPIVREKEDVEALRHHYNDNLFFRHLLDAFYAQKQELSFGHVFYFHPSGTRQHAGYMALQSFPQIFEDFIGQLTKSFTIEEPGVVTHIGHEIVHQFFHFVLGNGYPRVRQWIRDVHPELLDTLVAGYVNAENLSTRYPRERVEWEKTNEALAMIYDSFISPRFSDEGHAMIRLPEYPLFARDVDELIRLNLIPSIASPGTMGYRPERRIDLSYYRLLLETMVKNKMPREARHFVETIVAVASEKTKLRREWLPAIDEAEKALDSLPSASILGSSYSESAPYWEWIFQLPVLVFTLAGADGLTMFYVLLISSFLFALAHLPSLILERKPGEGVLIILARLGFLFYFGASLSTVLNFPLLTGEAVAISLGLSWTAILFNPATASVPFFLSLVGLGLNVLVHHSYNKIVETWKSNPSDEFEKAVGKFLPYASVLGDKNNWKDFLKIFQTEEPWKNAWNNNYEDMNKFFEWLRPQMARNPEYVRGLMDAVKLWAGDAENSTARILRAVNIMRDAGAAGEVAVVKDSSYPHLLYVVGRGAGQLRVARLSTKEMKTEETTVDRAMKKKMERERGSFSQQYTEGIDRLLVRMDEQSFRELGFDFVGPAGAVVTNGVHEMNLGPDYSASDRTLAAKDPQALIEAFVLTVPDGQDSIDHLLSKVPFEVREAGFSGANRFELFMTVLNQRITDPSRRQQLTRRLFESMAQGAKEEAKLIRLSEAMTNIDIGRLKEWLGRSNSILDWLSEKLMVYVMENLIADRFLSAPETVFESSQRSTIVEAFRQQGFDAFAEYLSQGPSDESEAQFLMGRLLRPLLVPEESATVPLHLLSAVFLSLESLVGMNLQKIMENHYPDLRLDMSLVWNFETDTGWQNVSDEIKTLALTPNGKRVFIGQQGGSISAWEVNEHGDMKEIRPGDTATYGSTELFVISPDGRRAFSFTRQRDGGGSGRLTYWNVKEDNAPPSRFDTSQLFLVSQRSFNSGLNVLHISPDGKSLFAGGRFNQIFAWDLTAETVNLEEPVVFQIPGDKPYLYPSVLGVSPDGKFLIHNVYDPSNEELRVLRIDGNNQLSQVPGSPIKADFVRDVLFSPDGKHVFVLSEKQKAGYFALRAFRIEANGVLSPLAVSPELRDIKFSGVNPFFSRNKNFLFIPVGDAAGRLAQIDAWLIKGGQLLKVASYPASLRLPAASGAISAVVDPQRNFMFVGYSSGDLQVYRLKNPSSRQGLSASILGSAYARSAPFWEWIFQLPAFIAVLYGADIWTTALVIVVSSVIFALAHLPTLITERGPTDGVEIILARLGVLFGIGVGLSVVTILPLVDLKLFIPTGQFTWTLFTFFVAASGFFINIYFHWGYNEWVRALKEMPQDEFEEALGPFLPYAAIKIFTRAREDIPQTPLEDGIFGAAKELFPYLSARETARVLEALAPEAGSRNLGQADKDLVSFDENGARSEAADELMALMNDPEFQAMPAEKKRARAASVVIGLLSAESGSLTSFERNVEQAAEIGSPVIHQIVVEDPAYAPQAVAKAKAFAAANKKGNQILILTETAAARGSLRKAGLSPEKGVIVQTEKDRVNLVASAYNALAQAGLNPTPEMMARVRHYIHDTTPFTLDADPVLAALGDQGSLNPGQAKALKERLEDRNNVFILLQLLAVPAGKVDLGQNAIQQLILLLRNA